MSSISQNVSAEEGDDLAFDVTLSNTADTAQTFAFSLTDGTTDSSDYGDVTFSDGVTLNDDGTITVPAGVESFTVTVAGAEDTVLESDETFTLSVGGVESTGTITNDDIYVNIDIDPITSDSTVNASEASGTVVITGVVTSGDIIASGEVTLVIGGESYTGAVDVSNGTFSITVDGSSLVQDSDRIVVANVTVTNSEGHVGTSQSTEAYFVDTSARGSIQVNSITSDDIVNIEESTSSIIVSGRVGFDAAAGDTVTLVIGDTTYTTTVMANKTWAVSVAGEDLAQNTTFTAKVTGEDSAGNPFTATTTSIHQVDLSIGSPTLTFESTGEDEVYNAAEVAAGEADTITATISVDGSEVGDILTYSVNGAVSTHVLTQAEIANGYVIEVAPGAEVKATLSDSAGNMSDEVSATVAIADVSIGTPVISFQSTGDDDIYNAAEVAEGEVGTITATISLGGSEVGDTLTFIVNGVESIHTLTQDDINNGYTIEVPPGAEVKATLSDAAGNTSTQASEIAAEADLSVSGLTSDITDATNSGSNDDTITNDATPDITGVTEAGATVTITYTDANGTSRTATGTADGDGKYTIAIDNALAEGSNTLSIKAVDVAGNETTTTQNVTVDTSVSGLTSDITDATNSGSNDDTITNDATPDITGVTEAGATVTITYTDANGTSRTATGTADGDGKYTIAIDNALAEGSNTLSIKAVDVAGNETTTTQNVTVDLAAEVQDEQVSMLEDGSPITIDILDNDESGASLVEDSFSYDESLGTVTLNEDGTITFTPKANVSGDIEIQYTVQDAAGNTSTATATVTVTAVADAPVIATSSDDSSSAQGISYSFWTGVDSSTYGGNGGTPEQLAALVDSYSSVPPVGSGVVQSIPNLDNIATGTLAVATTYVYLEAGSNYSFTGSADDTFYVKVGGDVIAEAQWDNGNSGVESQVLTVSESGYYPVEIAYHNEDGNGYVNLGIKIDGGDSQEFGTSTLSMYPTSVIPGVGEAVYEDDGVTVDHYLMLNAGYEDQAVQLESFTINLADTDGSESLSTVISGAPAGTVITIGDDEFTFGADGTVDVGGITDFTDMTLETPEDYSGEFTLTFTATATEASNSDTAVSTKSIDVTVYEVNDAPSISIGAGDTASITVSEEGLANANADTDGSTDTTDAVTASGTLTVSDDGTNADIKMSFVAPADGLYESNGVDIKWSIVDGQLVGKAGDETIVTITVSDVVNGQVTYQATLTGPIDHSDSSTEDTLTIDFGVVATDDGDLASATQTVSLVVEDDSPESTTTTDTIELVKESSAASSFTVSSIAGGFVNPSFSSGENRTQQQNTDSDSYKDKLSWDDGSGCDPTSIALTDTSSVASTDMGSNIVIGTFTHVNTPVSTSYKSLDSTNLEYKVTVNINGVATLVTLTAQVVVDETNNSNNDSSDYIQLSNLSSTTVTVDGVDYVVSLSGFLDSNGNVITQFSTAEDATSQYSVVANVSTSSGSVPESDYGTITGNVSLNVDVGADGGSVVAETITTDKGTLVVKADGSYEFTPSDSFAGSISQGSSGEAVFTYHVKDADGDTVENTLTLTVNDANDAPVATDDVLTTYTGLKGEYFGFNEQIDDLVDFKSLIAGKTADATFIGQNINYQYGTGDVGKDSNLQNFLGSDASSLSTDPGNTSDGGIRLTGYIYLEAGTYNFKVYADDGYQITIDGNAVATVTNNQSPNGTVHNAFTVEADGYYSIEMLWWDQGGDYVFQPTLSSDGGNTYSVLDSSSLTTNPTGSQSVTTTDGQSIVIDPSVLLSNDTDADGDTLSVTSVDNVQHGYAYINSAGKIIFVPEAGYTGSASFDYTITDGNGAYDSATATLEVDGDMSGQASVDVTITKVGSGDLQDPTAGVSFDSSVLTKHYDHDYNSWFNFQNKQYQVIVDDDVDGASMQTGNGDDIVTVGDDVKNSGHIDTGEGNDVVIIGDDITSSSSVHLGNGDNIAKVVDDVDGHIESGSGNDTVYIKGNLNGTSDLGDGNDVAVIVGRLDGYISGGSGTDSIWLQSYSYNDWVNNKDNIKYDVANFENIKFKDGAVIGDSNAFATSFTYSVSVDINDLASGEDVISVTISGVPDGAKLQQDGTDLTVNSDGTYTVSVTSGSTTIDNLTVVSETDSDIAEFELIATVTTDGDNTGIVGSSDEEDTVGTGGDDYLVGDSDEDSLLGGAGDDVLFGGDDESVDVLVGGEGSDIFILDNDTNLGNGFTQDVLMDFNASEDAIDISDLLDLPSETNSEDIDAVQAFLEANVTISEDDEGVKHLSIGEGDEKQDVATFGSDSNLDTDNSGSVGSGDSLTVIYNNQEYNINLDG
ncbi:tandem-95 repeat protein [Rhodanobacter aciditrophus]|uniref:Tandem-95 repeat protein n=2 Tax=Bacteria TaxID=2 RepID=A0ABW4B3E1_9GAMM